MISLANNLSLLLQQFTAQVTKMNQRREKPTQSFAGQVHENPETFANYMAQYFKINDIQDDNMKVEIFKTQLRDSARKWTQAFEGIHMSYTALQESFLRRYNSITEKSTAMSVLYGETQKPNESTELFIIKKKSLFARMAPETQEEYMTQVILDQLLPPLRSRLRGYPFRDVMELLNYATKAEQDVKDEEDYWSNVYNRGSMTRWTNTKPGSSSNASNQPPSPCRYCQEWHFNKDCPRSPSGQQGNFQRSPDQCGVAPNYRTEDRRPQQPRQNPSQGGPNSATRLTRPSRS